MRERNIDYFRDKLLREHELQSNKIERFEEFNEIDYNEGKELSMIDNHPAEIASETYEIEKNMALKEQQVRQLEDIDRALRNIDAGEYGICELCGQDIPFDRLEAMPTSTKCISCQDRSEVDVDRLSDRARRPVEEQSLYPPFGRSNLDETSAVEYDGEDAWQDVAQYNKTENVALDWYDNNLYDRDDLDSEDDIENISNQEYIDQLPDS